MRLSKCCCFCESLCLHSDGHVYTQQMPRCHLISKASARTNDLRMSESRCLQKAVKQPEADKQALQGHNAKCTKGPAEMRQKKKMLITLKESHSLQDFPTLSELSYKMQMREKVHFTRILCITPQRLLLPHLPRPVWCR